MSDYLAAARSAIDTADHLDNRERPDAADRQYHIAATYALVAIAEALHDISIDTGAAQRLLRDMEATS